VGLIAQIAGKLKVNQNGEKPKVEYSRATEYELAPVDISGLLRNNRRNSYESGAKAKE
jgi:hypothetical protein